MNQMLASLPAPVMRLNDLITGTVVTMDEWVQNEIYRLRNNIKPRHFKDYSELVYMFEDPSRFQALSGILPPAPPELIYNVPTDDDDDEDIEDEEDEDNIYNTHIQPVNNYTHFPTINKHKQAIKQEFQDDMYDMEDEEDMSDEEDEIVPPTTLNDQLLTPPVWLCKAFIELMRYCDKMPPTMLHEPKRLLLEFEKLQHEVNAGQIINVNQFRKQLTTILFGKIQLTEHLVTVWKLICEWVTRPPIHNHQNALRWIDLSLSAYITAKNIMY